MSHAPDGVRVFNFNGVPEDYPDVRWVTYDKGGLILESALSDAPYSAPGAVVAVIPVAMWSSLVGLPNPETGRFRKPETQPSEGKIFTEDTQVVGVVRRKGTVNP